MEKQVLPHEIELEYWKHRADRMWAEKACLEACLAVLEAENAKLRVENTAFFAQVQELNGQIEALKARVLKLTQQVYGRKSEQQPPPKAEASGDKSPVIQGKRPRGQQKGAKGHGRRQYAELPERTEIHDVPKEGRYCPDCGLPYDPFPPGEETSTRIDWRVMVERVVDKRLSYHKTCQCPGIPAIITAPPPPKVIPKGLFTAEFITRLMVEKYVLGRPLHRIGAAMRMEGLDLAQGTLVGVFQQVYDLLSPLYDAIRAHCLSAGLWQADETGFKGIRRGGG
jgi:Transposase IS66 family.